MRTIRRYQAFRIPKAQVDELGTMLKAQLEYTPQGGDRGMISLAILEEDTDCQVFEEYCHLNKIHFYSARQRQYSRAEIESAQYFLLTDENSPSDTDATKYASEGACPLCGVGLKRIGPLVIETKHAPLPKKKMFRVSLRQSNEWIVASEISGLFKGMSGFHFGDVCAAATSSTPLDYVRQIVIDNYLPRMATNTNFQEYDPPKKDKCSCNRSGWRLADEIIYERAALIEANDFNLTVERWYGGGPVGLNWPIVSQRVRRVILDNKLLRPACFEPFRIIEQDPGGQYKFELPLDTPASSKVR
jgi:hypothetical protein